MKKTIFIGSVLSSKIALETMIKNNIRIDFVFALDEKSSKNVSDYYPIHEIAIKNKIPYFMFSKIKSDEIEAIIKNLNPDFIFVIGLSQIIPLKILNMANDYCIGFHPTPLPKHRGRAAIPWQIILGVKISKVSLFKLDEGMDSGDIIIQYPYIIEDTDYAFDVYEKVCNAMVEALNKCLPLMYNNEVNFVKQNHEEATYLLTRKIEDGRIDWNKSSFEIEKLIRATSKPYPGAYCTYNRKKVIILKVRLEKNKKFIGFPGQIAFINDDIGVITNDEMLIIEKYETDELIESFIIGHKFE